MRALLVTLLLFQSVALAQAPGKIGYQGRLLKADGMPETGVIKITFSLFDVDKGGTSLWSEEQSIALTDGFYATFLGEVTPLGPGTFAGKERFLELSIGGKPLDPRQRVGSVPYALMSAEARNLIGGTVDATSIKVAGKTVFDPTGQLDPAAGAAFVEKKALSATGTLNDSANPVDWTKLKNVPSSLAGGGLGSVSHDGSLSGDGSSGKPLKVVFGATADAAAPGNHTHADYSLAKDLASHQSLLAAPGTINDAKNPVAWTALKGVPAAFADGTDDGLTSVTAMAPLTGSGTAGSPLALGKASSGNNGFLSSGDWTKFDAMLSSVASSAPLTGLGTASSPLAMPPASGAAGGHLTAADWTKFDGKLATVAASAPLAGQGTAGSPLSMASASAISDGYLLKSDYVAFAGKPSSVGAGTGVSIGGSPTAPTVAVKYGAVAGTATQGDDPRLSDARNPLPGSASYIQNQSSSVQAASLYINGSATAGKLFATAEGSDLYVGCQGSQCWTNANGIIGFTGYGTRHASLAFYPAENALALVDSSNGDPAGDNGPLSLSLSLNNFWAGTGVFNKGVGIGTDRPSRTLEVGRSVASDNADYGVAVNRHGTLAAPGSYSSSSVLEVRDYSGDGPSSIDLAGLLSINAPRIADSDPNAHYATLLYVANDAGTAFRVDGRRNAFVGFHATANSTLNRSLFVQDRLGVGTATPRARLEVTAGEIAFDNTGTLGRAAVTGMCAAMVSAFGYGSMLVVKSNGASCDSACDAQDGDKVSPYTNFYCYGSVDASAVSDTDQAANKVVGGGWYGNGYCGGTNGMSTYCCCKANYGNTKGP
jgi:hypothetical protein